MAASSWTARSKAISLATLLLVCDASAFSTPVRPALLRNAVPLARAAPPLRMCAPDEPRGPTFAAAAFLSYSTISALWYGVGVSLCVLGTPVPTGPPASTSLLRRAAVRVGRAWVVTFAASQISAPWRAAGAAAGAPVLVRLLRRLGGRGRGVAVAAALYFAVLSVAFGAVMLALVASELARLA